MVGTFPNDHKTPWGRLIGAAIDTVPGLIAFRTTNKAGAVLELGLAVLVGVGAAAALAHLRTPIRRRVALGVVTAVVAGSVAPALSDDLDWVRMDVPRYWDQAAEVVNSRGDASRVLMVPGTGVPGYSWG
jgi:arabinofuranan 3-O-arabinosyltransferase